MAENTNNGCGLWLFGAIISALILGLFTATSPPNSSSSASAPLVITVFPQTADAYFVVENNQISYSHIDTLDYPCNYSLVGRVLDLNGEPFTEYVVNIQMIPLEDGVAPPNPSHAFPGATKYTEDGSSGWSALLPSWSADYTIWLIDKIGGQELSPHIIVPTQDCEHNEARINFVQVSQHP
jgi:hypothetical protein